MTLLPISPDAARSRRLCCDVTTSWHFRGRHPVGIVRTEQRLLRVLLTEARWPVVFCVFDPTTQNFRTVPPTVVQALLMDPPVTPPAPHPHSHAKPFAATHPASCDVAPSLRHRLFHSVRTGGRRLLPVELHPPLSACVQAGDQLVRTVYRLGRRTLERLFKRHPFSHWPDLDLSADDLYINIGLTWDYLDMPRFRRLKADRGFTALFMCYDLITVLFPQFAVPGMSEKMRTYFTELAACADSLPCISECTRRDLATFLAALGAPPRPMPLVHLGSDICNQPTQRSERLAALGIVADHFVLAVGTFEVRKNYELLYHIWVRLHVQRQGAVPPLVIVGMRGWCVENLIDKLRTTPAATACIHWLQDVDDAELDWLYRHCRFTCYPSLYEGWGLPVAESLAYGKLAVTSNAASLPEIGGDLTIQLDPLDLAAWQKQIETLLDDPERLAAHEARLRADYQPMTWDAAGREFAAALEARG